mmetsp:Transcript_116222/g.325061  ORF Transcript_116222/g.325061 Transcript_116222/m.325061 type:complete len:222 (-) Transcript_116222:1281-1946(-)
MAAAACVVALESRYTWQTPSACPSTGILVFAFIYDTRALPPRGITRSITSSSANISDTCPLLVIKAIRSRLISPLLPASIASPMTLWIAAFECTASFPPLRSKPLPLAMERAEICGIESGRDSKITIRTPIGTVISVSSIPSASSLLLLMTPSGSARDANCLNPAASVASFSSVSFNLFFKTSATSSFSAASRSRALAASSSSVFSIKDEAIDSKISFLSL